MLINADIVSDVNKISKEILEKNTSTEFQKLYAYILLASAAKYFQQSDPEIAVAYANKSKILVQELFYIKKDNLSLLSDDLCKFYNFNKNELPKLMKSYLFREGGRLVITHTITKNVTKEDMGNIIGFYLNSYINELKEPLIA